MRLLCYDTSQVAKRRPQIRRTRMRPNPPGQGFWRVLRPAFLTEGRVLRRSSDMVAQQIVEWTSEVNMVPSIYVRPRAAAKQIGVSLSTILRLVEEGALPATRLRSRIILISEEDISALLAQARSARSGRPNDNQQAIPREVAAEGRDATNGGAA
jgi:excisionase family DNA binding protein